MSNDTIIFKLLFNNKFINTFHIVHNNYNNYNN